MSGAHALQSQPKNPDRTIAQAKWLRESVDCELFFYEGLVGDAFDSTGTTGLLAKLLVELSGEIGPIWLLGLTLLLTMWVSDMVNNAATALLMAPLSIDIAKQINVNPDAFLMAVVVGASCAFLSPIGHQNNLLVMGPGGYRFGDYWRLGLPLQAVVFVTSMLVLPIFWPL